VVVDAEREITVVTLDNVQQTICSREGSREQGPTKCPGQ
jgi:hypothetical protein